MLESPNESVLFVSNMSANLAQDLSYSISKTKIETIGNDISFKYYVANVMLSIDAERRNGKDRESLSGQCMVVRLLTVLLGGCILV